MADAIVLQLGGREVRVSNPDKVFFRSGGSRRGISSRILPRFEQVGLDPPTS
ncbi:MAG: hypothetical protein QOE29_1549 [Gaiellaceae bacterium]|jgi:hypothetical protein|nr:hypothetical protein [Gaiellaceae bacterium]